MDVRWPHAPSYPPTYSPTHLPTYSSRLGPGGCPRAPRAARPRGHLLRGGLLTSSRTIAPPRGSGGAAAPLAPASHKGQGRAQGRDEITVFVDERNRNMAEYKHTNCSIFYTPANSAAASSWRPGAPTSGVLRQAPRHATEAPLALPPRRAGHCLRDRAGVLVTPGAHLADTAAQVAAPATTPAARCGCERCPVQHP